MWSKYVTRRLAVQVAQAWNFGWGEAMKKVYGLSLDDTLVFRDDKKTDYYVDEAQYKKYVAGLYKLLKNKKFLKDFHKKAQEKIENILEETKAVLKQNLGALSNKELLEVYKKFVLPNLTQFYIRMWTVFNIGEPLANVVRGKIAEYEKDEKRITDLLLSFSSPIEPNDVMNEHVDILKIAISGKDKEALIKKHWQKYRHIPMYDFDHEPYTYDYFLGQLKNVSKPKKELLEMQKLFANRKKEFQEIIKEIKPDKDFHSLLNFLKENVFLRDYRDMIRQKYNLELKGFYEVIGERLGLSIEEVAILTNEEIIEHLKFDKKYPRNVIEKRKSAYLLIQKGKNVKIYSGEEAILKAKEELKAIERENANEIKGVIGSTGKVSGRVVVVFTNKDLDKVKGGDVLVATMTRQDFVPAIRKSVALVTDEGSVTCHAAIIARELKKPCIVATKIGTEVLKDGDFVEVDANKGIVKLLKYKR